jgi:transposase
LLELEPGVSNVEVKAESARDPLPSGTGEARRTRRQRPHPRRQELPADACWSHARRKFYEAHQVCPGDSAAKGIVLLIDDLFRIDAEARAQNLDLATRDPVRQQQARPLLETIRQEIDAAREDALPASKLGGAITYTLGLWERPKRFLDYPELELSTNLAENSMRGVALGRKNWIHIASPQAGPKVAAILSVVETCRRLEIPVRKYLDAVLPGFAEVRIQKLAEFTPEAWAEQNR